MGKYSSKPPFEINLGYATVFSHPSGTIISRICYFSRFFLFAASFLPAAKKHLLLLHPQRRQRCSPRAPRRDLATCGPVRTSLPFFLSFSPSLFLFLPLAR